MPKRKETKNYTKEGTVKSSLSDVFSSDCYLMTVLIFPKVSNNA